MLLTLTIIPLGLGLTVVIMAAIKKLKPQPVMDEVEAKSERERPEDGIQSDSEREKIT